MKKIDIVQKKLPVLNQIHFGKKKETNLLFKHENHNKITFKRRDFYFANVFRNFKFFYAIEAITNHLKTSLTDFSHSFSKHSKKYKWWNFENSSWKFALSLRENQQIRFTPKTIPIHADVIVHEKLVIQNSCRQPQSSATIRRFRKQKSCCHISIPKAGIAAPTLTVMQGFQAKKDCSVHFFPAPVYCVYTPYTSIPRVRNPSTNQTRVWWLKDERVNH